MKTLVRVLIVLPLALVVILLAVANRTPVQVSLDPFSGTAPLVAFSAPLFVVVLIAIASGVLVGGVAVWWSQGRHRRKEREQARELERLRGEVVRLRQAATPIATPADAGRPPVGYSNGNALALPTRVNVH